MTGPGIDESAVELAALEWFSEMGYETGYGPNLAAGEPAGERTDPGYRDVVLEARLRSALRRLNPRLLEVGSKGAFDIRCSLVQHLMMARTTIDIDTPILRDLKKIQQKEKKSLGKIVSELLADAIGRRRERPSKGRPLRWRSADMGARVDLEDKETVYAVLDEPGP